MGERLIFSSVELPSIPGKREKMKV
jgi:hypothetical protein